MADLTFEEIAELAEKLTPDEQAALGERLRSKSQSRRGLTREQILAEFQRRKTSGEFEYIESLYGQFAHPDLDLSDDSLNTMLHAIATEWENELDEYFGNSPSD